MKTSVIIALFCAVSVSTAADPTVKDVVFARTDTGELRLDLFLPDRKKAKHREKVNSKDSVKKPPLVIFIHGGGWSNNSYKKCLVTWVVKHDFALASVGYRLSQQAIFPAQIHDVKAAVRWLRGHADDYGYDATRIGVIGTSAGGHLAALLGVSGGIQSLEGTVGEHRDQSSRVQAVVDYYGPTDFVLRSQNQPNKTENPRGSVYRLLGGKATQRVDLARLASPAFHVSQDDPPLLIIHGDKDTTVYMDQSQRIADEYKQLGLDVTLKVVPDGGHGRGAYFEGECRNKVIEFLKRHLRK